MNSPADNYGSFLKKRSITKNEIIRGYNSYKDIIKSSKIKISGRIKVIYSIRKPEGTDTLSSPRRVIIPKVGFLISKKIFTKAVTRNKIRRQLKESYRILKGKYSEKRRIYNNLMLIFSLSGSGNDYAKKYGKLEFTEIKKDMDKLLDKISRETISYF